MKKLYLNNSIQSNSFLKQIPVYFYIFVILKTFIYNMDLIIKTLLPGINMEPFLMNEYNLVITNIFLLIDFFGVFLILAVIQYITRNWYSFIKLFIHYIIISILFLLLLSARTLSIPLDFLIIKMNLENFSSSGTWITLKQFLIPITMFFLLCFVSFIISKRQIISPNLQKNFIYSIKHSFWIASIFIFIIYIFLPGKIHSYSFFFDTMINAYKINRNTQESEKYFANILQNKNLQYPLLSNSSYTNQESNKRQDLEKIANNEPNIFIILIESLGSNVYSYVNSSQKQKFTPFLNKIKEEGVFFDDFYSISMQTISAQIAVLCGIITPYQYLLSASDSPKSNLRCISDILKEFGYTNFFFKGYHDIHYDNTYHLFSKENFDYLYGLTGLIEKNTNKKHQEYSKIIESNSWSNKGDDIFFNEIFILLDSIPKDKKVFSVLTTISNHFPFQGAPEKYHIYKNPKSLKENYVNSIHYTDHLLKGFFEKLNQRKHLSDNSIIFILGDHSYPVGEYNVFNSYISNHHNTFYQVPLIIYSKRFNKTLKEYAFNKNTYSQINIAPTILDLLNIQTENHFIASSLFQKPSNAIQNYTFFLQPYAGGYLMTLKYPYKYVEHRVSKKKYFYDLIHDPEEKNNIIQKFENTNILQEFQKMHTIFDVSQNLLLSNRYMPENTHK